jgi:hypothetical protein
MILEKCKDEARIKKEEELAIIKLDFNRLSTRRKELIELGRNDRWNDGYLEELDCMSHFFEAGSLENYHEVVSFCRENGIERIIDIGCAYGHQSEIFLQYELQYVGVTDHLSPFWNEDTFEYVVGHYPCKLPTKQGDLAVSFLCLTWNCYLIEGEKTLIEQCEALKRDFEHCVLNANPSILGRYFSKIEEISKGLYYFSNK